MLNRRIDASLGQHAARVEIPARIGCTGGITQAANGSCLPAGASCSQVFDYEWDEVGRLDRARRWDMSSPPSAKDPLPTSTPAVELLYAYDASDMRVLKTAVASGDELYTAYVFDSLELRRAPWRRDPMDLEPPDYADDRFTEVPYLAAHGVRLARLSYGDDGVPGADLHVFLELADHLGSNGIVIDKATGKVAGRQTFMRMDPANGVAEIGHIYWGPLVSRKPAATEALYLFARHLFDDLGYRRFEWKCDNENTPSKRAALRFGFRHEGVFHQHLIIKGRNRDTAWFAMLDKDWGKLRSSYEAWLSADNFDAAGSQRQRLEEFHAEAAAR